MYTLYIYIYIYMWFWNDGGVGFGFLLTFFVAKQPGPASIEPTQTEKRSRLSKSWGFGFVLFFVCQLVSWNAGSYQILLQSRMLEDVAPFKPPRLRSQDRGCQPHACQAVLKWVGQPWIADTWIVMSCNRCNRPGFQLGNMHCPESPGMAEGPQAYPGPSRKNW